MERRTFIRQSCALCLALGTGSFLSTLSSCSSIPIYKTEMQGKEVTVPASLFSENELQIIRPRNLGYDIALRKDPDGNFTALLMRCTHADNQLVSTGKGFTCNLHGSTFDKQGAVTKGPAEQPLQKFATNVSNDQIIITLN